MKKQQRLDPKFTTDCFQVDSQLVCFMFGNSLNAEKDDMIQSSKCSVQLHENSSPYADAYGDCERLPVRTGGGGTLFSRYSFSVLANLAFLDSHGSTFLSNAVIIFAVYFCLLKTVFYASFCEFSVT